MRILRVADRKEMPWKNGGGVTTEIAVHPQGAGLGDFQWRVSTALVAADGPFSMFPGIDRSLTLLKGGGMILSIEGRVPYGMTRRFEPLAFPADVPTSVRLIDGPITDLNVMTRRGAYESEVGLIDVAGEIVLDAADETTLVFAEGEGLSVTAAGKTELLGRGDVLIVDPGEAATLGAKRRCHAVFVTILKA
jgi:environmental stress-induced protein Ves